ncbi:MAG: protein-L-isoaspartate(D-aspartate) O-methyltransferase [Ignavibacteriales bacterium]|nr:protein-L-isoaspartate(D-aspartate) O-methyltransferase [Ignavibacteriales bacterium]
MKRILLVAIFSSCSLCFGQEEFTKARERMVREQISARGVSDTATLRAMRTVPRHNFVPLQRIGDAYGDFPLPIGEGQTISQPYIVALMTELIKPGRGQHVLEIGTGSGYQAAVLAEIVDSVFTIEIVPQLAQSAAARLKRLGYGNVLVRLGDGYLGWPEHAPFDAILVTAAAEHVPQPLVEQLKDGGVMVIPVGEVRSVQTLTLLRKRGGRIVTEEKLPVRFVPLIRQ